MLDLIPERDPLVGISKAASTMDKITAKSARVDLTVVGTDKVSTTVKITVKITDKIMDTITAKQALEDLITVVGIGKEEAILVEVDLLTPVETEEDILVVDTQADTQADILAPMLVEATDTTAMGDKVSLEAPEVVTVIRNRLVDFPDQEASPSVPVPDSSEVP